MAAADAISWPGFDTDPTLSDEELASLARGGDPNAPVDASATPLMMVLPRIASSLPGWYMPPAVRPCRGWRAYVVYGVVGVLVTLEILGLCSVFGEVVIG